MTSQLFKAAHNTSTTDNGAITLKSSMDANVDFFFLAGASRGRDLTEVFKKAYEEDKDLTIRALLWCRDIRGGAGERQQFRDLVKSIQDRDTVLRIMDKIPEVGRWDDMLVFAGTEFEQSAFMRIQDALAEEDALCAKWMPRKGDTAVKLRKFMDLTPKQYRKLLVNISNTVESLICDNKWKLVDFNKVPSKASAKYSGAFSRHAPKEYTRWKKQLLTGEAKVNASAIFPHDIVSFASNGDSLVADQQWNSLPDYLQGSTEKILPMVDTSGSMTTLVTSSASAMDIAVSLGIYIAERNEGIFKNQYMSFSNEPSFNEVPQEVGILDKAKAVRGTSWGFNTNLAKAMSSIVDVAVEYNLSQEELPTQLLVLSDMEFDSAGAGAGVDKTNLKFAVELFERHGYKAPKIVFWNLCGREGNTPARANIENVALVSGFSPSIMKSLLSGKDFSPIGIMLNTLKVPRYDY